MGGFVSQRCKTGLQAVRKVKSESTAKEEPFGHLVHCQQSYEMLRWIVSPAKAGVQCFYPTEKTLDSSLRRNDGV
jgi:hypothetical protein